MISKDKHNKVKDQQFLSLIKSRSRNRLIITTVVLLTFLFIMFGIGLALFSNDESRTINQEWKEILLLLLGAFIASYGKVIDFWFQKNNEIEKELIDAAEGVKEHNSKECE